MAVKFTDNSAKVKGALNDAVIAYLYEAGGELEAQTKRNMPPGHWNSQIKNSWMYEVDEAKGTATIGNPLEAALWVEFGTGEYSISPKGGRKGYWVYVSDSSKPQNSYTYSGGKQYTLQEARSIVAMMRAKGLDAHYTKGQAPKRPLFHAFNTQKGALIKRAQEVLKARFK